VHAVGNIILFFLDIGKVEAFKVGVSHLLHRSYYKCTSPGCSVRKHVERGPRNLKHVITTYEGKHDHEVPASRNSSRGYSAGSNLSLTAGDTQPALALARNTKAQVQEFAPSFYRKPVFNNDYLRSKDFPGNFSNEMNLWSSSIYSVKFPPIQNVMPYDSFGFNNHHLAGNHSGSVAPPVPDFPRSLSPCLQTAANLSLARDDCRSHGKPDGQAQTFLQGQQW
jgi:WRKY transcription factor 2